ncbi:hypothetical protein ACSBLW_15215 [Thioclava sp. FR2]|uniref:hypothetical protein n=1 Tax=Thioclava sp. FR2 TaxID=3445780 RepID=UPI003EB7D52D
MFRLLIAVLALTTLVACGGAEPKWASDEAVAQARYVHSGPTAITLFTVTSTRNGSGAHSGLMINGSERLIFDPAGTWHHPKLPERNDVHFGMSPKMVSYYIDYHARETYDVWEQTLLVSPETAALITQKVKAYGAVPKAQCSKSISSILTEVPGFESLPKTWYPRQFMEAFGEMPGVITVKHTDNDTDDNHGVLLVQAGDPRLKD